MSTATYRTAEVFSPVTYPIRAGNTHTNGSILEQPGLCMMQRPTSPIYHDGALALHGHAYLHTYIPVRSGCHIDLRCDQCRVAAWASVFLHAVCFGAVRPDSGGLVGSCGMYVTLGPGEGSRGGYRGGSNAPFPCLLLDPAWRALLTEHSSQIHRDSCMFQRAPNSVSYGWKLLHHPIIVPHMHQLPSVSTSRTLQGAACA